MAESVRVPGLEEEAAAREKHIPAVAVQTQHAQAARTNPEQRASVNHGKPAVAATPKPGAFSDRAVVPAKAAGAPYNPPAKRAAVQPAANAPAAHPENNVARPAQPNNQPEANRPATAQPNTRPEPSRPEPNRPEANRPPTAQPNTPPETSRPPTAQPNNRAESNRPPTAEPTPGRNPTGMNLLSGPKLLRRASVRSPSTPLLLQKRGLLRSNNSARKPAAQKPEEKKQPDEKPKRDEKPPQ